MKKIFSVLLVLVLAVGINAGPNANIENPKKNNKSRQRRWGRRGAAPAPVAEKR